MNRGSPVRSRFRPGKVRSAYALWAVKEEGEPRQIPRGESITDNLDYPSGYWFFWRTISFSEETGRLIEGEWGGAGDICRADYVADMVLPGGAVFARVQGELDDGIPFDWEVRRPWTIARRRGRPRRSAPGSWRCPLSASASIEAIPSPYKIDVSIVHGGTLTHDMARNLLVSAGALLSRQRALRAARQLERPRRRAAGPARPDSQVDEGRLARRGVRLPLPRHRPDPRDRRARRRRVRHTLAHNLLISGFEEMERDNTKLISRQISEGRLDIGEIARAFVGAMGRKTGAALDAALEGKHAGCYSRDVDAPRIHR